MLRNVSCQSIAERLLNVLLHLFVTSRHRVQKLAPKRRWAGWIVFRIADPGDVVRFIERLQLSGFQVDRAILTGHQPGIGIPKIWRDSYLLFP